MTDTNRPPPPPPHSPPERELLPQELLWAAGGHASDIVLTALADGQRDIVPADVLGHVERCTTCTIHLGHAALLSLHTHAELGAKRDYEIEAAKVRRPLPRLAISLGLVVAALGLLPSLVDDAPSAATARTFATRDMPLFLRGLGTLARRLDEPGSPAGLLLTYAAAGLLMLMGIAVARILPKRSPQKESSR